MKTTITAFMLALATLLVGCGAPAPNANTNTNANTSNPVAAAPTADALMATEKQAHEAYIKGDSAFFNGFLSDKFAMLGNKGEHHSKADLVKMVGGVKCDVKDGWSLDKPEMAKIDADTYVVSYVANMQGSCTSNGHTEKMDKPMRMASIYVRSGDKWLGAWHGETTVIEPKGDAKKDEPKAETKKEEPKKDEAKKEDAKKPAAAKKEDTASTDLKATDSAVPAKAAPASTDKASTDKAAATDKPAPTTADPNTADLVKLHQSGWDAWAAKDAAKLTAMTTSDLSWVAPDGMFVGTKDAVIKGWTTMDCKDVKTTKVSDGFAVALSPTVELLFAKGAADGTCDGHKNSPLWNAAAYVKDGSEWKMAFMFESPAM